MKSRALLLSVLSLSLLVTGCISTRFAYGTRTVASISGAAHSEKPDYRTIESTLAGVGDLLKSRGWKQYPETTSYHLPGGRFYYDHFTIASKFACSAEMGRKSASFRFYEWEQTPRSGVFTATDEERAQIRELARVVETYLRSRLPSSYELHFSTF